jgi:acyl-CoA dehydrogenase
VQVLDVDPLMLRPSPEQEELRSVLRDFFKAASPHEVVLEQVDSEAGYDPSTWRRMAVELGVQGLAVPEVYGGSGYSFAELGVALEEAGRALLCGPLFSTSVLAANALLESRDDAACARLLPAIVEGRLVATMAMPDPPGRQPAGVIADRAGGGWTVSGSVDFVLDGHGADVVLVVASGPDGPTLFACERASPGFASEPLRVLDGTRRQARLWLRGVPATPVGATGDGDRIAAAVFDVAVAALAAEQLGASGYALDQTVEYVAQRRQFGRPIGSFQAIKHRLADLLVDVEAARSAAAYATWAVSTNSTELPLAASTAKAVCSDTFTRAAGELVQMHGGMGFTWEHPAHLYLRRARSSEVLLGSPPWHRRRVAHLAGVASRH